MSDLQTAVASFLGAGLGAGGTLYAAFRAERAEHKRTAKAVREQALKASRIVQEDLAWGEARVDAALANGKYWSRRYALRLDAWVEYRDPLSAALPDPDAWSAVEGGFAALRTLELQAGRRRSANELSRPKLTAEDREQAEAGLVAIRAAMDVLRPIAGVPADQTPEPEDDGA
jgi:hypothetical protein